MSERLSHPSTERLQAFVEESLADAERAVVDSHLTHCSQCRTEVAEIQSVFAALSALPTFEPITGFADRVMVKVRVRRPLMVAASEWLDRVTPQSTRGWATAAAVFALPVIGATIVVGWLLAQPGVDAQGLWTVSTTLVGDAVGLISQWVWTQLSGSFLAVWATKMVEYLGTVGRGEIGLALVMFAVLTAGSIYVLYQNLFRNKQERRIEHASYVF